MKTHKPNPLGLYVLDEQGQPQPEPDTLKWAHWVQKAERHVKDERVKGVRISTVFLGLDHNLHGRGAPVLWETMTFGPGEWDHACLRCAGGREQAEAQHAEMVRRVKAGKP